MDEAGRRLYVSHATRVHVIDIDEGKVVGEISGTEGVHGIAVAPDLRRGFTSNERSATVTIFDLKTLQTLGQAKTDGNPDAIVYDPASHQIFTFNRMKADATSTVIDAATGKVTSTIILGGRPEFAVADGKGQIFVNLDDKNQVAVIDTKKMSIKTRWSLAPGEEPTGMAFDAKHQRLFIVCGNKKMIVMDSASGKVIAALPIGDGSDAAAFDPQTGLAFSSNSDSTMTVVREVTPGKFGVAETVTTQRGARTVALDPKTHNVFMSIAEYGPPPAATADRPNPRPGVLTDSFAILVVGRK